MGVLVDFSGSEGELRVWVEDGGVDHVADAVTSFSFARGRLAYVSRGVGFLSELGLPTRMVRLSKKLRSISAAPMNHPAGIAALALAADDELFAVDAAGGVTSVAREVAKYEFSTSGEFAIAVTAGAAGKALLVKPLAQRGPLRTVAHGVTSYAQASSRDLVAVVADGEDGPELKVADVAADTVRTLAPAPMRYEWARDAPVLVWISGANRTLGASRPAESSKTIAHDVVDFAVSPDGSVVAYTNVSRTRERTTG